MKRRSLLSWLFFNYLPPVLAALLAGWLATSQLLSAAEPLSLKTRGLLALLLAAAVALALLYAQSLRLAGQLRRSLGEIEQRAKEEGGEAAAPRPKTREVAQASAAVEKMAARYKERMQHLIRERDQKEALISSMAEGVIAVDAEGKLLTLNQAAADLFYLPVEEAVGKSVHETMRNRALLAFIDAALKSRQPLEKEMVLPGASVRHLQVRGTRLCDATGKEMGVVVVIADVTRIQRLESLRKDFVANVSHELKTPITSIKGFLETLRDGALERPEDARRFLDILLKQAERLSAIIEDLLTLSRVEQEAERDLIVRAPARVREVLEASIQDCAARAARRRMQLLLECPPDLTAWLSVPLMEQAVANLIDNAIKYGEEGGKVQVSAQIENGELVLRVRDEGIGIEEHHLPRLFERFYRVDKARSRKLGGTGLGLAIVKHIAQAHGGRVSVESQVGRGSVFSIHVPAAVA